jgi:hypothetical protein
MSPEKYLDSSYTEFEQRLNALEREMRELLKGALPTSEFLVLIEVKIHPKEGLGVELYIEAETNEDARLMETEPFHTFISNLDPEDWVETSSAYENDPMTLKAVSYTYYYGVR